ncbi:MAG: ABC transporter ATP-binding protein [Methylosarcina sp.]
MAEIVLDHVSKRFPNGTVTLKEASFTIHDGEFFILVGPSGCGKSTLLNMIVGLEEVTAGEIRVNGKLINDLDPKDRNMAMVFQSYAIYPHLTVRENIAFPLQLAKVPEREMTRRVEEAAAILELSTLLDRKPASLSGGQRQRVAMGRAIVREPQVFLLDEPLSNLDARLRVQMRSEIARLQKRLGTTMIYVTHDQTEAMTLGDRVAVLNHGEVQQLGTPRELYRKPANLFVAAFLGSPAMNLLPAQLEGKRLIWPLGEIELKHTVKWSLSGGSSFAVAGIRPEHIRCVEQGQAGAGSFTFEARMERVEWLGAELYAYFDALCPKNCLNRNWPEEICDRIRANGIITVVARLDPSLFVGSGDRISLQLDQQNIQLFDPDTGSNRSS